MFGSAAAELAIGAPEWLHVAPTFREFAQERYQEEQKEEWILLASTMMTKNLMSNTERIL
jgi:hypothetical protein